jgi:hypothetical protein
MEEVLFLIMVPSLGKKVNQSLFRKKTKNPKIFISFGIGAIKDISGGDYLSLKRSYEGPSQLLLLSLKNNQR